jgi:hypothetical protein
MLLLFVFTGCCEADLHVYVITAVFKYMDYKLNET